ncbi:bifunctional WD40-YVTN repeat-like-containing domain superfamily/WD40-repeat-containing domain superfamily/Vacuolar protein sorting-associated protein Vps41-Vps8 [Babesia duncani]|uniref:Bifunctional WD40-YVTN repeat-like-containing domain superfamily/WD40-repeat-containing domain superfamily/Vacuolar protein sorting-associated protein Vps41-Vps8 n=1 Tax=Babesia duncani TaxID=323732 RepID=A0AAD9PM72_9APIC|nr:bifunctional WD40-YVTN repeat-like-containing domain superfamily/WD40-repeat-containing domain superfamily/Vacuolar protein sorting-associated protein Vps41-Vps8 [Babesia duncani]
MPSYQLEEILDIINVSDDSDDSTSYSVSKKIAKFKKDADYKRLYNEILNDDTPQNEYDTRAGSFVEIVNNGIGNNYKNGSSFNKEELLGVYRNGYASPTTFFNNDEGVLGFAQEESKSHLDSDGVAQNRKETYSECTCKVEYRKILDNVSSQCGECFDAVRFGVQMQIQEWSNKHKLHLINQFHSTEQPALDSTLISTDTNDDSFSNESLNSQDNQVLDAAFDFHRTLGIEVKQSQIANDSSDNCIKLRHDMSLVIDNFLLFDDGTIVIDEARTCRLENVEANITPCCIAANSTYLLVGTSSGSVVIADISNYNTNRSFNPSDVYKFTASPETGLDWIEIDYEPGSCVTSLDILPQLNWICVGYDKGIVKLLHYLKGSKVGKIVESSSGDVNLKKMQTGGFGFMAGAVSSALGNFKRAHSYVICEAQVFSDEILFCKFTHADSQDEIICSNRNKIAILTYTKSVLSHTLSVKPLQGFNDRLKDSDEIVSIVSCASNPQCKFITSKFVSGLIAIFTLKHCIILSTKPNLAIVFRVSLEKLLPKTPEGSSYTMIPPSATWMVINNLKSIQTLLVVAVGRQIRFLLLDVKMMANVINPQVTCTNFGHLEFICMIRSVRIITRDILAFIDFDNMLYIVQVNLLDSKCMHYDIIRTVNIESMNVNLVNLLSTITVHSWDLKIVASGFKKFAALVTELFQGKRLESIFELKTISIMAISNSGIINIEMYPWIKVIGEWIAKRQFPQALALVDAISHDALPSLYSCKSVKVNVSGILVYILHQASAHVIRLVKQIDSDYQIVTTEDNLLDFDGNVQMQEKTKSHVLEQISHLCKHMVGTCISMQLYNPLCDLIYRCFNSVKLDSLFVKYLLINIYNHSVDLVHLKAPIFEVILDAYDNILSIFDNEIENAQDKILLLHECAQFCNVDLNRYKSVLDILKPFNLDLESKNPSIVVYHVICNALCSLQRFCFENNLDNEKSLMRLSNHGLWHALAYCESTVSQDFSALFDCFIREARNQLLSMYDSQIDEAGTLLLTSTVTETKFIIRVLYLCLYHTLTFCNANDPVGRHCTILDFLMSNQTKVTFPISMNSQGYFMETLDDEIMDFASMDSLSLPVFVNGDCPEMLYACLCTSPRLFFTVFAKLYLGCHEHYREHIEILGKRLDCFNFIFGRISQCLARLSQVKVCSLNSMEKDHIYVMACMLLLGTFVSCSDVYLSNASLYPAMYWMLKYKYTLDYVAIEPMSALDPELMTASGYFNHCYFHFVFSKKCKTMGDYIEQMRLDCTCIESLVWSGILKQVEAIYNRSTFINNWTQDPQFEQMRSFCSIIVNMVDSHFLQFSLGELIQDFAGIITNYSKYKRTIPVFEYLKDCLYSIKMIHANLDICDDFNLLRCMLMDSNVQGRFIMAILENLPQLIVLDLEPSIDLVISIFELEEKALEKFNSNTMELTWQHLVTSALKHHPQLQLMVLDAMINKRAITSGPFYASCFSHYLELLCQHKPESVASFLQLQPNLDITVCLKTCKVHRIHDAIVYLLIRSGNLQQAANCILESLAVSSDEMAPCFIKLAHDLCHEKGKYMPEFLISDLWFGMLKLLLDAGRDSLIVMAFRVGILKFIRPTKALMEILKYRNAPLKLFLEPLYKLLLEVDFEHFMVNHATVLSSAVLSNQFSQSVQCNHQGIYVNLKTNSASNSIANSSTKTRRESPSPPSTLAFEHLVGVVQDLKVKNPKGPDDCITTRMLEHKHHIEVKTLHQDMLSTFINPRPSGNQSSALYNFSSMGLSTQYIHALRMQHNNTNGQHLHVYQCGHVFQDSLHNGTCSRCSKRVV